MSKRRRREVKRLHVPAGLVEISEIGSGGGFTLTIGGYKDGSNVRHEAVINATVGDVACFAHKFWKEFANWKARRRGTEEWVAHALKKGEPISG